MNKLTLTLAAGAFALISACSEEKDPPSPAELCKAPISAACLEGDWHLDGTDHRDCQETGTLILTVDASENSYEMTGGVERMGADDLHPASIGTWTVNEGVITTSDMIYEPASMNGTIKISEDGNQMEITGSDKHSVFSRCSVSNIEKFTRQ